MARVVMKKDDLRPNVQATLVDNNGDAVDLSSAVGVRFIMKSAVSATAKVDAAATISDAVNGVVLYSWTTGDTDTRGTFNAEFEVNWGSSVHQTFPANGYLEVEIQDDLGGSV